MDPDTPAQSLKTAVDIIEHVATIQSKAAQVRYLAPTLCLLYVPRWLQEILWKAVREFWIALVPIFEDWQQIKVLPGQVSDLKQRIMELDQRGAALELAAENENKQRRQHAKKLQVKEREIEELQMLLRDANERNREERERNRVLLARHSASVRPLLADFLRGPHSYQLRKPNIGLRSNNSKKSLNPESKRLSLSNRS